MAIRLLFSEVNTGGRPRMNSLRLMGTGLAGYCTFVIAGGAVSAAVSTRTDAWSALVTMKDTDRREVVAVHGIVRPDGKALLIGYKKPGQGDDATRRWAGVIDVAQIVDPLPAEVTITGMVIPTKGPDIDDARTLAYDTPYCSGHTLLPNGKILVAGGTRITKQKGTTVEAHIEGLPYAWLVNGAT
jgi:hypothetical protein